MADKLLIDLESTVPSNATSATIEFSTLSGAKGLLYRYDGDTKPLALNGPNGRLDVVLSTGRKLYLERLDASVWEIYCCGYGF